MADDGRRPPVSLTGPWPVPDPVRDPTRYVLTPCWSRKTQGTSPWASSKSLSNPSAGGRRCPPGLDPPPSESSFSHFLLRGTLRLQSPDPLVDLTPGLQPPRPTAGHTGTTRGRRHGNGVVPPDGRRPTAPVMREVTPGQEEVVAFTDRGHGGWDGREEKRRTWRKEREKKRRERRFTRKRKGRRKIKG